MTTLYQRLAETDIRLLQVVAHDGATATLELHTYPRAAAPEYDAVSYAWGEDTSTTQVTCNGAPLTIRTNLFRALPFLRDARPEPRGAGRPLWIDAVCLDQTDATEKAVHVPQMGAIYEGAARTLVWLGEAADGSDQALQGLEALTEKLAAVDSDDEAPPTAYGVPPEDDPTWVALQQLHGRPWFHRLWTLQEVGLAGVVVLLCGDCAVPWDALVALHTAAMNADMTYMLWPEADPTRLSIDVQRLVSCADEVRKKRALGERLLLPDLLDMSGDRGYAVSVDRVWALLGLLDPKYQEQIRSAQLVDYSPEAVANYHESFLGVATLHVRHDTTVALDLLETSLRTVRNPRLPSWCPDWHTDKRVTPGVFLVDLPQMFAGFLDGQPDTIPPFMQVNDGDASLELCGLLADVVECTSSCAGLIMEHESYPFLVECLDIIGDAYPAPYDDDDDLVESPDVSVSGDETPISESSQKYTRAREAIERILYINAEMRELHGLLTFNGRKFFRTQAGEFGIGPADLQPNDFLCVMYKAKALWVLRPCAGAQEDEDLFELVGMAYTPSLLYGTIFEGMSCEEMMRFRIR